MIEAVVVVSQPQTAGQASFSFPCIGSLRMCTVVVSSSGGTLELGEAPICDGTPHTFTVRVQASRGVYHVGSADALTFADVESGGFSVLGVDQSSVLIMS